MDESFNALYKIDITKRKEPWRDAEHLEAATMTYIHWINHKRLHSEIGDIPPAEFEANLYVHLRVETNNPTPPRDQIQKSCDVALPPSEPDAFMCTTVVPLRHSWSASI